MAYATQTCVDCTEHFQFLQCDRFPLSKYRILFQRTFFLLLLYLLCCIQIGFFLYNFKNIIVNKDSENFNWWAVFFNRKHFICLWQAGKYMPLYCFNFVTPTWFRIRAWLFWFCLQCSFVTPAWFWLRRNFLFSATAAATATAVTKLKVLRIITVRYFSTFLWICCKKCFGHEELSNL